MNSILSLNALSAYPFLSHKSADLHQDLLSSRKRTHDRLNGGLGGGLWHRLVGKAVANLDAHIVQHDARRDPAHSEGEMAVRGQHQA